MNPLPPCAHMVQIHQLRVPGIETALHHVSQSAGRIRRGQARNPQLHGPAMQGDVVPDSRIPDRAGIDDTVEGAVLHQL